MTNASQAGLSKKGLPYHKMRFHEFYSWNSTTKAAAKDIRFHALANSFTMIFYQEYMSTSLSTPGLKLIVKAAEGRPCALEEQRQRKKKIMIKSYTLVQSN